MTSPAASDHPSRRAVLVAGVGLVLGMGACRGRRGIPRRGREALERGREALWARQAPDGAFRSDTYGVFRSGHSLTPFVLSALGPSREDVPYARGLGFLEGSLDAEGALGRSGAADYPVYATALAIRAWTAAGSRPPQAAVAWLAGRQLLAGWEGHAGHGGWDFGHRTPPVPPDAGHVDLSMTRRALEALAGVGLSPGSGAAAEGFVGRCRGTAGGYVYSPTEPVLNKGGCEPAGCAGYGTATCDAVLALAAVLGPGAGGDPRVRDALDFLRARHVVDRNPGLEGGPMEAFGPAMRGYYRAASARVFARFGGPAGWREQLLDAVVAEQRPDGSWASESPLQKEDDPLVASAFAVSALRSIVETG